MTKQKVTLSNLDTPALLVDMDKLESNIREMSQLAIDAGVKLRPHIKVHESAYIAKMQIEAGACGIEVGGLGQAEAIVEAGIDDIVIAHPIYYAGHKFEALKRLLSKSTIKIAVMVDMIEQAEIISQAGQAVGRKVPVLIKIDVGKEVGGSPRCGVLPGEPVLRLAKQLCQLQNVEFTGIYAHEIYEEPILENIDGVAFKTASIMSEMAQMLRSEGIKTDHVSMGASNTLWATCRYLREGKFPEITEIHPGNFIIGDIVYMKMLGNTRESCVLTVLVTVQSTSHPDYAQIDAGFKTFGADAIIDHREDANFFWEGKPSYGSIQERPDLWLGALSGEIGNVYYTDPKKKLSIGERLEIVPNNAILVINMHDQLYGIRNGVIERVIPVTARGRGT